MNAQDQARATAARIKAESEAEKEKKAAADEAKKSPKVINTKEEAAKAVEEIKEAKAEAEKPAEVAVVAQPEPQPMAIEPAREVNGQLIMTEKHVELIRNQIAKNATPEEFDLFMMMVRRTRLDPLLKQLYFFKYKNRKASEAKGCRCYGECTCGKAVYNPATYVTSIDGLRIIAHRNGMFDGVDEPVYNYVNNALYSCSIKVYKKGSSHAFAATVKFAEYTTGKDLWNSKPETMIAKVAEAHALRKAFPQDLSGIYTTDEMGQAEAEQHPQKALPKPVQMVTKQQVEDLKILMTGKQVTKERLQQFVVKAFKVDSIAKLTAAQMQTVLKKLDSLPTPPDPLMDEPEADEAEEIFSPEAPAHRDESVEIDLDEIDAGIEAMRAKEGN